MRAVSPSRGYQSLPRKSCGGFCLHIHQQEFCLSPFPEFFTHTKSSFSCAYVPLLLLAAHAATGSKETSPEKPTSLVLDLSFLDIEQCSYTCFLPSIFSLWIFLFKVEEKLHQGWFISFIYCNAVCLLGGVLPLTELVVFRESLHIGNGSAGGEYQLPKKAKSVAKLHPLSHGRC